MQETLVQLLGEGGPLVKGQAAPTTVFWPGGVHGLSSACGRKKLDMTERLPLPLLRQCPLRFLLGPRGAQLGQLQWLLC